MKLQELLEAAATDYLDDRTDLVDGEADSLFSDKTLVRYMNEFQRRICRRAWVLVDTGHAQAGVLTLRTGQTLYTLHKSVLRVMDATPAGAAVPLPRSTDERLFGTRPPDPDYFDVNLATTLTPGPSLAFSTDAGTRMLRVSPEPSSDENGLKVVLKVARMPVCFLDHTKKSEEPEIPEEWQLDGMVKYAAGKCLTFTNIDATAKTEGRRLLDEVESLIREARQERERAWGAPAKWRFCSTTADI